MNTKFENSIMDVLSYEKKNTPTLRKTLRSLGLSFTKYELNKTLYDLVKKNPRVKMEKIDGMTYWSLQKENQDPILSSPS